MDACKEYIDKNIALLNLIFEGDGNSEKADALRDSMDALWHAMTEDEIFYAEETLLRTQIYMGGVRECDSRDSLERPTEFSFWGGSSIG